MGRLMSLLIEISLWQHAMYNEKLPQSINGKGWGQRRKMADLLFTHNSSIIIIEDDLTGPQSVIKGNVFWITAFLNLVPEQSDLTWKKQALHSFLSVLYQTNNTQHLQMQVVRGDGRLWEIINRLEEIC